MDLPSIRQLECIVAVSDHLNFSRAAEACFITQPALSAQVRQLETALGVRIFERDKRKVITTEVGRELVERARRALNEVEALVEAARISAEPLSGTLRVGVIPTVAPYVLPLTLPAIRRKYPKFRMLLHEDQTDRLVEMTKRGDLDMLLLALEADLADLVTRPLYTDRFLFAAPAGHSLSKKASIDEHDLASEDMLLLDDGHCLRDQALSICTPAGAQQVDDFRASSLNTLIQMVSSGIGATLLPSMALESEVHGQSELFIAPLVPKLQGRTIGLAWRPTSARAGEFELLAKIFMETAPEAVTSL